MTEPISMKKVFKLLTQYRKNPSTNRFPKEIWDAISQLAERYPLKKIAKELRLHQGHLRKKILTKKENAQSAINFVEVPIKTMIPETIIIEISSGNLKAKIQGPLSCLSCLDKVFGGR